MKSQIDQFLACKKFAIAGVSRDKNKFGNAIFREMKKKDYNILPVNPNMEEFEGEKCYKSVSDLPADVEALIVITKPDVSHSIVKEALKKGIRNIFIQQGAYNAKIDELSLKNEANIICKQCILMFANPTGIHKFHERLAKFFRFYPN
ncbi:MAG: CoA-binding protein [Bacteroidales bacterium]